MLHVHRAESGTALVAGLAEVLSQPLDDPFAAEVVAVPAKGVERWLAQQLSHTLGALQSDGVCANVTFPSPSVLLDGSLSQVMPEHAEAVEAWSAERSVWPLLEVIDQCAPYEPWCHSLAVHLGASTGRRYAVARKLAELYGSYGRSRPQLLVDWQGGVDGELPEDLAWQAELWRRLRQRIGTPSPAELLGAACARLRENPQASELPQRVSIYGATRLTPSQLTVLDALAQDRDVHLWLHHASPALWNKLAGELPTRRRAKKPSPVVTHPLLNSLSRDVQEMQHLLRLAAPKQTDQHRPDTPRPDTLLGRLQTNLRDDVITPLGSPDPTIQVHSCHGRARQVEVLRETILGLLARDPTLEPRDVLIMCPDVETFAPLIAASFGGAGEGESPHPAARLRVRLADRALRQTNPLLAILSQLLEISVGRVTASQVLDLAGTPPVRRRFGLDDDDLERLREWVVTSGVRWGLSTDHRKPYSLSGVAQGTWRSGLDRLLLGVTMQEGQDWLGTALPLDDVDSADISLAGRLAELVDRLETVVMASSEDHPVGEWLRLLEEGVLGLTDVGPDEAWQVTQLTRELAEIAEAAGESTMQLNLADVSAMLGRQLQGRPTRASFRTGTLTVCTLVPMRSVPHRVVCLLGLDDGAFPRQGVPDGDDLLAREPCLGERDPRSEDRQLLLDAICAAGEHLVITYSGADERTGAPVPPAVPLGEILDALPDGIVRRHPLQPFDARNFTAPPFSFDRLALEGALSARAPRQPDAPFLSAPLPALPHTDVQLADLIALLEHPARGFLRQRLEVAMTRREEEREDALPLDTAGLKGWAVGNRVLQARLQGIDAATCKHLEELRGELPPGPLGARCIAEIGQKVEALLLSAGTELVAPAESVDVSAVLADGRHVSGTVPGVRGDVLLAVHYSTLAAKHRLRTWIQLLALTVSHPEREWRAVVIGRYGRKVRRAMLGPVPGEALSLLSDLVAVRDEGLSVPLPLPVKSGADYADRIARGGSAKDAAEGARKPWQEDRFGGEQEDAEHALTWGPWADLSVLLEAGLPALAERVWLPLLQHETQALV